MSEGDVVELNTSVGTDADSSLSLTSGIASARYEPDLIEKIIGCFPGLLEKYTTKKERRKAAKKIAENNRRASASLTDLNDAKLKFRQAMDSASRSAQRCVLEAKSRMGRKDKSGAMQKLAEKRKQEQTVKIYGKKIENVEQMQENIRTFLVETSANLSLGNAAKNMTKMASGTNENEVEDLQDTMRDTQDQFSDLMAKMKEVMSGDSAETMESTKMLDEDELEAELAELMQTTDGATEPVRLVEESHHGNGGGSFPASLRTPQYQSATRKHEGNTYTALSNGSGHTTSIRMPMHHSIKAEEERVQQQTGILVQLPTPSILAPTSV